MFLYRRLCVSHCFSVFCTLLLYFFNTIFLLIQFGLVLLKMRLKCPKWMEWVGNIFFVRKENQLLKKKRKMFKSQKTCTSSFLRHYLFTMFSLYFNSLTMYWRCDGQTVLEDFFFKQAISFNMSDKFLVFSSLTDVRYLLIFYFWLRKMEFFFWISQVSQVKIANCSWSDCMKILYFQRYNGHKNHLHCQRH